MEAHKRTLGIIYIISGLFQILTVSAVLMTLTFIIRMIAGDDTMINGNWPIETIVPVIRMIAISIFVLVSAPTILGGWALLNHKKWAFPLVLVMGCLKLFSPPIGTAIGIYTIWVYAQDQRTSNLTNP